MKVHILSNRSGQERFSTARCRPQRPSASGASDSAQLPGVDLIAIQRRDAPRLQPLVPQTEPRYGPHQHLHPIALGVEEYKQWPDNES
jgi:hypothetical protein